MRLGFSFAFLCLPVLGCAAMAEVSLPVRVPHGRVALDARATAGVQGSATVATAGVRGSATVTVGSPQGSAGDVVATAHMPAPPPIFVDAAAEGAAATTEATMSPAGAETSAHASGHGTAVASADATTTAAGSPNRGGAGDVEAGDHPSADAAGHGSVDVWSGGAVAGDHRAVSSADAGGAAGPAAAAGASDAGQGTVTASGTVRGDAEVHLGGGPGVRAVGRGRARLGALLSVDGLNVDGYRTRLADLEPIADVEHAGGELVTGGSVEATVELEHSQLPRGGGRTHLVVRLRGGESQASARARVRVHLVIDRSSSMQSTWADVLAAARAVVDQLSPDDEIQVVAYGSDAEEVLPPTRVGDGRRVKRALGSISVGGGTNIEAGLRVAYGAVARRASSERPLVILLSDGVPNGGAFTADELGPMAARARADFGCTTTVVGLGNQFDPDVLRAIAVSGRGGYHVAREVRDLGPTLRAEIRAQARLAARDVRVNVALAPGVELTGASTAAGVERTADGVSVAMPQLREGDERRLVFEVHVAAGARAVARVDLRYRDATATPRFASKEVGVRFGAEARLTGSVAALAAVDADLGRTLDAAAAQVLNGRSVAAAELLKAHVRRIEARAELQADGRLRVRTRAVGRFATALQSLVGSASHTERREVSLAMGGLALRLQR